MQEIVRFRDYVQTQNFPMSTVPQDHLPLIAKLVHESDKTLAALTKSLLTLLFPTASSLSSPPEASIRTQAVEEAIKNVADRVNYGVTSEQENLPPSCAVWRWEVKDYRWLPEVIQVSASTRLAERKQAQKFLQTCFDNLSEEDRSKVLGKKKNQDIPPTEQESPEKMPTKTKTLKEKREAESTKKSAAAFANFFFKAKPKNIATEAEGSKTSSSSNDFQDTFKPFLVKKCVCLTPINWFVANRKDQSCEIIQVNNEIIEVRKNNNNQSNRNRVPESWNSYFSSDVASLHPISQTLLARRQFRQERRDSVQSIMNQLNEAELQGDHNTVRRLLQSLRNREKVAVKVLFFHENNRPGYLGTWTKTSNKIGPRAPFALDPQTFDYEHDSDAEWEADEPGEDVDSEGDSVDEDTSSTASDLDDWLVDSDDIIEEKATTITPKKRKTSEVGEGRSDNKKRKVIPLVPFQKGPIWEKHLGDCEYDLFDRMRIQMFNDAPVSLNPFEYVATSVLEKANGPKALSVPTVPNAQSANSQMTTVPRRVKGNPNVTSVPKTDFPNVHIKALLDKVATVNTNSFVVLVDSVYQDLKSLGIKKNALEVKLREVSEKDREKKLWKVKETAWTQYGLK
ncbi:hypothetical protein Clacol_006433 [Clathrus columnatus]|uniref:Chromatin assembly factor 1 subunit A dimerization domain-containing protein n=1 Tax=Clathrus columnatus TaxID=1419009 RepID=A0AAV5AEV3_9AGAM|nr:hypothetical protein Clacol_006433 [Clathrus columnatus]